MKKLSNLVLLMMLAMTTMTFSSCGDDETDEIIYSGCEMKTTAVHKIKITVTGNPGSFRWSANFKGMTFCNNKADQAVIYDGKGNVLGEKVDDFTSVTGETTKDGVTLAAGMVVTDLEEGNTGEITICFEGYMDGRRTNAKTFTIRGGEQPTHSIGFTTVSLD